MLNYLYKKINKRAMTPASILMIILGIVALAVILGLVFYFGVTANKSTGLQTATDWSSGFGW